MIANKVTQKIIDLLESENIPYSIFEHQEVRTSEEAARVRNEPLKIGAKAIVFYADKIPLLVVVPGDKRVDTKAFKAVFEVKDLRMASPDEVLQITSVAVGGVPPFGSVMNLKTHCDKKVFENEKIAFNAGAGTVTVKMKSADFKLVENPIVGSFSIDKKSLSAKAEQLFAVKLS